MAYKKDKMQEINSEVDNIYDFISLDDEENFA